MRLIVVGIAILAVLAAAPATLACGFDQVSVARTAREADAVVLGTVVKRAGTGTYTYTLRVERVIRGPARSSRWVIRHAGVSDCGMLILAVGERVVIEYYQPGRKTTGPWFYAWKVMPDGKLAFSDSHLPPLPATLDDLLARYAAAPDTATAPAAPPAGRPLPAVLLMVAVASVAVSWRRFAARAS